MGELTGDEFAAAEARGAARLSGPRAESARYDAGRNRVIVRLTTGLELGFAPRDVEGLHNATAEDLRRIELTPFGLGLHFPTLDADLYVPALLEGITGSPGWMARRAAGRATARERRPTPRAAE